ncbi:MAG: c-type cytochrome [Acidobacteriia bacterium]|nr:c-type cytochrome [Terriglobia bacterium]
MWKKIVLGGALFIVLAVSALLGTLALRSPAMAPPSNIEVQRTPERVARGKYLFEVLSSCADCHSEVDDSRFGFPVKPGGLAKGKVFPAASGLPGTIVPSNLTQDPETGTGNWTDGELIRAIREGIGRDGRALFPLMPYHEYRYMSDEDVQSLVAYMRTLRPVRNALPKTKIQFPVNLLIKGAPQPVGTVASPDRSNPVAYGKYAARIAGCQFCHTPVENDQTVEGKDFSGGHSFQLDKGVVVVSANLTPDPETGTGRWTEQQFLDKFYQYKEYAEKGSPRVAITENTIMPWLGLAKLEPDDLKAIFAYLKTVPPIQNAVETKPSAAKTAPGGK